MGAETPEAASPEPTSPAPSSPNLPDPKRAIQQLFEKRPGEPLIASHTLFRTTSPAGSPSAPAAGVESRSPTGARSLSHRIRRLIGPLRTWTSHRQDAVVGLDLGSNSMKLIRVERRGSSAQAVGFAYDEYPPHAEGQTQEECLRTWLQQQRRQGLLDGQLVVGCANARVIMELVMMPKMPEADLGRAVIWEAKERLSAEPSTYSIRHLIIGETTVEAQTKYEVLILVAPREELIGQWRNFSEQGFRMAAIEPGMLATIAACESMGLWRPHEFIGLLDIGRRHSTLALIVQGAARFLRSFPVAGDSITQSIMDYCQLDYETAEAQKREIGLSQMALEEDRRVVGLEDEPRVRVSHALGLYLERLAAEVVHSLRYFTYELGYAKERTFDTLYLCGGGSRLKNLPAFLSSRINARVEVADALERWPMTDTVKQRLRTHELSSTLLTSLGLALRPLAK